MRRGASILVAAALCACVALVAVPAIGAGPANTNLGLQFGFTTKKGKPFFTGRIKSGRKACTRNRKVNVFRERNPGRGDVYVAGGRSDQRGRWRTKSFSRLRTGGYVARTKPVPGCRRGESFSLGAGQKTKYGGRAPGSGYP